jgi:hypothetical protein
MAHPVAAKAAVAESASVDAIFTKEPMFPFSRVRFRR